jgi:hypothetical protein
MIEICTNNEWIGQQLDNLGLEDGTLRDEAATEYYDVAVRAAESSPALAGHEFVRAKGQRSLYHVWNGAQFTHRRGIFGTFAELTDSQIEAMSAADEAGRVAAQAMIDRAIANAAVATYTTDDGEDRVEVCRGEYRTYTRGTKEPLYVGDVRRSAASSLGMTDDEFNDLLMSDPSLGNVHDPLHP